MRGSRIVNFTDRDVGGIIPAGAGLTCEMKLQAWRYWDHPRGCGAHEAVIFSKCGDSGSSPRVRGSHAREDTEEPQRGIIPAGAGLTTRMVFMATTRRDHPRGCGAHLAGLSNSSFKLGSSPRVRGSLFSPSSGWPLLGIIPAGAGLTDLAASAHVRAEDHPRGCGAHQWNLIIQRPVSGSSPRVRGSPTAKSVSG